MIFRRAGEQQQSEFLLGPPPGSEGSQTHHHGDWDALAITELQEMGCKEAPKDPQRILRLWEQAATATPLGQALVYLVGAQPSIKAYGQATTAVALSPYLKQLLACLAFPCLSPPQGIFLCLLVCFQHVQCGEYVWGEQHSSRLHISAQQQKSFLCLRDNPRSSHT